MDQSGEHKGRGVPEKMVHSVKPLGPIPLTTF